MSTSTSYAWYARTTPMFLVLVPLGLGISVWFPETTWERLAGIILAPAALAILLGEKGRDRGRRLQATLWASWGGPLLTQYLRHRDSTINQLLKAEYHGKLAWLLPNIRIPSASEEAADPVAADQVFDACAQHIVNVVREDPKRFDTAFRENRSYGFRRNLWGIRPLGTLFSICGLLASMSYLYARYADCQFFTLTWLSSTVICAGLLFFWAFLVNSDWVRAANDAYARRVLEAIPRMEQSDRLGG